MTVQDVFFIHGRGLVTTGKVEEGPLRVGDEVSIDGGETVRVDGIEAFRKTLEEANAGDNVGVLFSHLEKNHIARGAVLSGGGWTPAGPTPPAQPSPNPFGES
jgi:translation elongation factor EF-Tu-like GTPase